MSDYTVLSRNWDEAHPKAFDELVEACRQAIKELPEGRRHINFSVVTGLLVPNNYKHHFFARIREEVPDVAPYLRPPRPRPEPATRTGASDPLHAWEVAMALSRNGKAPQRLANAAEDAAARQDEDWLRRRRKIVEELARQVEVLSMILDDPLYRRRAASSGQTPPIYPRTDPTNRT